MLEPGRVTGRVRGGIYVRERKTNGRETILTRENIFVIMYVVTLFFFFFLLFFFFFFLPPLVTFSNQISFNAMARERERKRGRGGEQAGSMNSNSKTKIRILDSALSARIDWSLRTQLGHVNYLVFRSACTMMEAAACTYARSTQIPSLSFIICVPAQSDRQ